jgi:hypothetical protein
MISASLGKQLKKVLSKKVFVFSYWPIQVKLKQAGSSYKYRQS